MPMIPVPNKWYGTPKLFDFYGDPQPTGFMDIENPSVAMTCVGDTGQDVFHLRSDWFDQRIVLQQILLDAIDDQPYDPKRSVGDKFHGRTIALL